MTRCTKKKEYCNQTWKINWEGGERKTWKFWTQRICNYVYSIYLSLCFELHRIMFIRILNIMTVWFCIDVSWLLWEKLVMKPHRHYVTPPLKTQAKLLDIWNTIFDCLIILFQRKAIFGIGDLCNWKNLDHYQFWGN